MNLASEVRNAVEAIDRVKRAVDAAGSDIDGQQIRALREAIDELETVLNEKKRGLDAARDRAHSENK